MHPSGLPNSTVHLSSTTSQNLPPCFVGRGLESADVANASATSVRLPLSSTSTSDSFCASWALSTYISITIGGGRSAYKLGRFHSCRSSNRTSVSSRMRLNYEKWSAPMCHRTATISEQKHVVNQPMIDRDIKIAKGLSEITIETRLKSLQAMVSSAEPFWACPMREVLVRREMYNARPVASTRIVAGCCYWGGVADHRTITSPIHLEIRGYNSWNTSTILKIMKRDN